MDLSYFEETNGQGETVVKTRPEVKALSDLERVMALCKPLKVINIFVGMVILGEQWKWLDDYSNHLIAYELVEQHNANLPIVDIDEQGNVILDEIREYPISPSRPNLLTVDEFKEVNAALFDSYNKMQGAEIGGQQISLNESNQNGIASVLTGLLLADEVGADIFPINFKAQSNGGTVNISFSDLSEFKAFALEFMAARQVFFS